MIEPLADEVREDPPGWHVSWGVVFVAIIVFGLMGYMAYTSPSTSDERGKFWCNGSTGVYESRNGSSIIPEPFDPACNKVDEP